MFKKILITCLFLPLASAAWSASFTTNQVRVIDGDTLEVIPSNKKSERIRLLGIDAPESKQEFGSASSATLQKCIGTGSVKIEYRERDKYSRILGKVWANGKDCNLNQVKTGSAWHYKHFQNQQPPADRISYSEAEKNAKKNNLGLWSNPNPINPYKYRKAN